MDTTYICIVLDESGSMVDSAKETLSGINKFIKDQKEIPGKAFFTLVKFSYSWKKAFDSVDIQTVPELTEKDYTPAGGTNLFDTLGFTLTEFKEKFDAMPEAERPTQVVFVIVTDGENSCATKFSDKQVEGIIQGLQTDRGWQFLFFGAKTEQFTGSKVSATASSVGMTSDATVGYDIGKTEAVYSAVSASVGDYRTRKRSVATLSAEVKKSLI